MEKMATEKESGDVCSRVCCDCLLGFPEQLDYRGAITLQRPTGKSQCSQAPFRSRSISASAGIRHDDGNVAQIHPVPNRGFDANFKSNARDHERVDPAVAEGDIERGADES